MTEKGLVPVAKGEPATGVKAPVPDVFKFVEMSYLNEALKELGKK